MSYVENFPGGFQTSIDKPLDYRSVVADIEALEPKVLQTLYVGLIVFDQATNKHYKIETVDGTQAGLVYSPVGGGDVPEGTVPLKTYSFEKKDPIAVQSPTDWPCVSNLLSVAEPGLYAINGHFKITVESVPVIDNVVPERPGTLVGGIYGQKKSGSYCSFSVKKTSSARSTSSFTLVVEANISTVIEITDANEQLDIFLNNDDQLWKSTDTVSSIDTMDVKLTEVARGSYLATSLEGWGIETDRDPTPADDRTSTEFEIRVNQIWLNNKSGEAFICTNANPGTTKWLKYLNESDLPNFVEDDRGKITIPKSNFGVIDTSSAFVVPTSGDYTVSTKGAVTLGRESITHFIKANDVIIDKNIFNIDPKMPSGYFASNILTLTAGDVITQSFNIDSFATRKWTPLVEDDTPIPSLYFPSVAYVDEGLWAVDITNNKVWRKDLLSGDWTDKTNLQGGLTDPGYIATDGESMVYGWDRTKKKVFSRNVADLAWTEMTSQPDFTIGNVAHFNRNEAGIFIADVQLQNVWFKRFGTETWVDYFPVGSPLTAQNYNSAVVTDDSSYMSISGQKKVMRYYDADGTLEDLTTYTDYPVFSTDPILQVNIVNGTVYFIDVKRIYVLDPVEKRFYDVTGNDFQCPFNIYSATFNHDGLIVTGDGAPKIYEFNIFSIEDTTVVIERKSRGVYYPLAAGLVDHIGESGMLYGTVDPSPSFDSSNAGVFTGVFYTNDITKEVFICKDDLVGAAVWDKIVTEGILDLWDGNSIISNRAPTSADNAATGNEKIRQFAFWYDATEKEPYVCMSVDASTADWRKLVTVAPIDKQTVVHPGFTPGESITPETITANASSLYNVEVVETGSYVGTLTYRLVVNGTQEHVFTFTRNGLLETLSRTHEIAVAEGDELSVSQASTSVQEVLPLPNMTAGAQPLNNVVLYDNPNNNMMVYDSDLGAYALSDRSQTAWSALFPSANTPKAFTWVNGGGILEVCLDNKIYFTNAGGSTDFTNGHPAISDVTHIAVNTDLMTYSASTGELYVYESNVWTVPIVAGINERTMVGKGESGFVVYDQTQDKYFMVYAQGSYECTALTGQGIVPTTIAIDGSTITICDRPNGKVYNVNISATDFADVRIQTVNPVLVSGSNDYVNWFSNESLTIFNTVQNRILQTYPASVSALSIQYTAGGNTIDIPALGTASRKLEFVTSTALNFANSGLDKVISVTGNLTIDEGEIATGMAWRVTNIGSGNMVYATSLSFVDNTPVWPAGVTKIVTITNDNKILIM